MPLFNVPKVKEHNFKISPEMKTVIDSGLMSESQIKKFAEFPELLEEELENELAHPSYEGVETDIFNAVYTNNPNKFFSVVARVGVDPTMLDRIRYKLINKQDFNRRKDLPLLKRIENVKSVFNVFKY